MVLILICMLFLYFCKVTFSARENEKENKINKNFLLLHNAETVTETNFSENPNEILGNSLITVAIALMSASDRDFKCLHGNCMCELSPRWNIISTCSHSFCNSLVCLPTYTFLKFSSHFFELPNDEKREKSNMDDKEVSLNWSKNETKRIIRKSFIHFVVCFRIVWEKVVHSRW